LYHLEDGVKKSSRNRYLENGCNYADMDFGACSLALCIILKKERRKVVVEKGIWKIVVITENVDFGVCS